MTLYELLVKLKVDKGTFDSDMESAKSKTTSFGEKIGPGLKAAAKVGVAAVTAAAAGIAKLTKTAVDSYATYEQMVGGVQKLYGNMGNTLEEYAERTGQTVAQAKSEWEALEGAQNTVLNNAKNAYKEVGMSANDYMEIATSFSASLISSLGGDTQAAAEQTQVAMKAIADNVNTFGTNIEDVTNAFKGFSKQNYTMLDNLKLGYGGTKQEMERLIADANEYAESIGLAGDLTIDSFSDQVTAIELIQEKQNIAGTTAREAATTIEGSLNMTKAAWDNLMTGMADDEADFGLLIDNFVQSATTFAQNVIPRIQTVFTKIPDLINGLVPVVVQALADIAPSLITAVVSLITNLVQTIAAVLSQIISAIMNLLPSIISSILECVAAVISALGEAMPQVISAILEMIPELVTALVESIPLLINAALQLVSGLALGILEALPVLLETMPQVINSMVTGLISALPQILQAAVQIVLALVDGLVQNLPSIVQSAVDIIYTLVGALTNATTLFQLLNATITIVLALAEGIISNLPYIIEAALHIINSLASGLLQYLPQVLKAIGQVLLALIAAIIANIPAIAETAIKILSAFASYLVSAIPRVVNAAKNIPTRIKEIFKSLANSAKTWGSDFMNAFTNSIKAKINSLVSTVSGLAKKIRSYLHFSRPDVGPLRDYETWMPDMVEGLAGSLKKRSHVLTDAVQDLAGDMSMSLSADANLAAVGSSGSSIGNSYSFNIYPSAGMDEKKFAEYVYQYINSKTKKEAKVW